MVSSRKGRGRPRPRVLFVELPFAGTSHPCPCLLTYLNVRFGLLADKKKSLGLQGERNLVSSECMNSCLAESDLLDLGNEMLASFERRVAAIPSDLCAPFHTESRQLETELLTIYKFVALAARRTEDLSQVARAWQIMVKVCDESATRLNALAKQHPDCGADAYYDRVLDLRNKCHRLQQMHS